MTTQIFRKKDKIPLIVLGSMAVVLVIIISIFLNMLRWEKNLIKYVEKKDWTAAGSVYKNHIKGNENKEERADEILYEAVDMLREAYTAESMTYSDVEENLKAIEDFWDDDYVQVTLEEVQSLQIWREAERVLVGRWELTDIQVKGLSFLIEEYLSIYGVNIGECELSFRTDGTLSIASFMGVVGEGVWGLEADGTYYIETDGTSDTDEEDERTEGRWNYDGTTLILMDAEGNVFGECGGATLFLGKEGVGALFERRGN